MAKSKYKRTPYVHASWPKMVYHPVDGSYVICQTEDDVPEGFLADPSECERTYGGTEERPICTSTEAAKSEKAAPKKAEPKKAASKPAAKKTTPKKVEKPAVKDDENDDDSEIVTLESLELSRDDAIEMLDEGEVQFKKNASNDTLAGLVAALLEE